MSAPLTLGLDAARALDPARYRIGAATPRAALRPASREELAEALRAAAASSLSIVPWGGGVALAREEAPKRYDLAIDLAGLDRVIEYEPGDFTVTAECGVTLAALRERLAAHNQELPLEAPYAERATLGGALAANASGPRRLRFGSPRDRILGARFALGDGTLARTGGKVVKNVAGFGIHRLLCGSRGGLAILVEASLKLCAAPATRVALVWDFAAERFTDPTPWSRFPRLEPALLTVVGAESARRISLPAGRNMTVVLGLEDDAPWVERQAAIAGEALGPPAARLAGDEARALWQRLADLEETEGPRMSFATAANTPAALDPLLDHPCAGRLIFHATAGRLHLFPDTAEAPALARRLAELEFALIDARGLPGLEPAIPPMVATLGLRARIRAALDPARQMALGERWAGGEP